MCVHCDQRQLVRLQIVSKHLGPTEELSGDNYFVTEQSKLWSNQAVISYFFDATEQARMDFVISAMKEYTKYANVKFVRSQDPSSASVRVSFSSDEQHWTAVGTDALVTGTEKATMNLGWISLDKTPAANSAIALHAIGHVLGLVHEDASSRVASFAEYDKDSIMRYSSVEAISTVGAEHGPQLSDRDKAWLALNYPKTGINRNSESEDKGTLGNLCRALNVDDETASRIIKTGDVSERRFVYSSFIASQRAGGDEVTSKNTLGELTRRVPEYPDALLKLQSHLGPKAAPGRNLPNTPLSPADIERYIGNFVQLLGAHGGFLSPTKPSQLGKIVPGLLQLMERLESSDEEAHVTQEDLDNLQTELARRLGGGPEKVLGDVQHGVLGQEPSAQIIQGGIPTELPGIRQIIEWFFRVTSEGRPAVDEIPADIADKMHGLLRRAPPRDIFQQVYSLCFASTFVHPVNGTRDGLQQTLHKLLGSLLPQITRYVETGAPGGQWDLVWGPVVWKENPQDTSGGPDLVWYIAYNDSVVCREGDEPRPTYVLAISGTPSTSASTFINSSFDITFPVDFKGWVSGLRSDLLGCKLPRADTEGGGAYLSRGTARTVWQLLTEEAPQAEAGERRLLDFLRSRSKSNPDMRVIITGHSLSGALCPALALILAELEIVTSGRILTYPIAGLSLGNAAFATLFSETFPPIAGKQGDVSEQRYQVWNCNLVNQHDLAPQAWSSDNKASPKQNLSNVNKMIPGLLLNSFASHIVSTIIDDLGGLAYMPIQSQYFSPPPSKSSNDLLPQHVQAYHDFVGFTPPDLQEALH